MYRIIDLAPTMSEIIVRDIASTAMVCLSSKSGSVCTPNPKSESCATSKNASDHPSRYNASKARSVNPTDATLLNEENNLW
jgi:hypothetical protein